MKSRITIEVDFDNGNLPVIQILQRSSDDVRDALIQQFLQSLQHTSRWCRIEYIDQYSDDAPLSANRTYRWRIKPIVPSEITKEIELAQASNLHFYEVS